MNPGTEVLENLAIFAYGIGAIFGILFLASLFRTDWYRHPWGRNVAAFMVCLTLLEIFAFSRRYFGIWPGQNWMVAVLSIAIATIQAWRWWLQFTGNRSQRKSKKGPKEDRS